MDKTIETLLNAGFGAIAITKEKAENLVEELVQKGKVAKKDQPEFVKKLLKKGKEGRAEIEKIVEKSMTRVLNKLNIPTKSDIDALMKKIERLGKEK